MPRNPRGWVLEQVISGGQQGVDQMGLQIAQELRYKTGGTAPKGWRTDDGPAPWLGTRYGLKEHPWSSNWGPRTDANAWEADGTVWFGVVSPGHRRTKSAVLRALNAGRNAYYIENPSVAELQAFILENGVRVLNVAGNRLRTHPESTATARVVLTAGLIPF